MSDDEPEEPSEESRAETNNDAQISKAASTLGKDSGKGIAPSILGADFAKGINPSGFGALAGVIVPPQLDGGIAEAIGKSTGTAEAVGKSTGFARAIRGIVGVTPILPKVAIPEPLDYGITGQLRDFTPYIDQAPRRAADAAEQTAEYTRDLLNAMRESLQLNENARQENAEFAAFTRRVSVLTIVVAFASPGLGVASLVVAIVAINHP